jgi:hypothetical protein
MLAIFNAEGDDIIPLLERQAPVGTGALTFVNILQIEFPEETRIEEMVRVIFAQTRMMCPEKHLIILETGFVPEGKKTIFSGKVYYITQVEQRPN